MLTKIKIYENPSELGMYSARLAGKILKETIEGRGEARLILATGTSQFELLRILTNEPGINWSSIQVFHLDEYLGISRDHPASFRRYLYDRFISHLPIGEFHEIKGDAQEPLEECLRLNKIIQSAPVDLALIGIGENGHIAFNDPPANFTTNEPYIIVDLDLACRTQQVGEGWFSSIDDVPQKAITMSVSQIMLSKKIICTVPDSRKARAVKEAIEGPVTPDCPASILQNHPNCHILLDKAAASLLTTINPA